MDINEQAIYNFCTVYEYTMKKNKKSVAENPFVFNIVFV